MKGVILAGGKGTRLDPLTRATNKHLLPVGREPMIFHPIRQLVGAGIDDILVVTGAPHMGAMVACLGGGDALGCSLTYRVQERPGGIGHALALAAGFAHGGPVAVMLGDNVFENAITPYAQAFAQQGSGARVVLKEVADPERYGIATLEGGRIAAIVEKPARAADAGGAGGRRGLAVVGLYFYDPSVFGILAGLAPSPRGELEITAVNNAYIARAELRHDVCSGQWTDAGTFESLREANRIMSERESRGGSHGARGPDEPHV
jgi:glucose-1-phosphate thymidylyltransferase